MSDRQIKTFPANPRPLVDSVKNALYELHVASQARKFHLSVEEVRNKFPLDQFEMPELTFREVERLKENPKPPRRRSYVMDYILMFVLGLVFAAGVILMMIGARIWSAR